MTLSSTLEMLPELLASISTEPCSGTFFRYIRKRYAEDPLSTTGSLEHGGRYNLKGRFGALCLGSSAAICQAEVSQGVLTGGTLRQGAYVGWKYTIDLQHCVNLNSNLSLKAPGLNRQQLTVRGEHEWTANNIGLPLYERKDVEALLVPSACLTEGHCLDVFMDRLLTHSQVKALQKTGTWPEASLQ
jgi:RES domain-containing protein